MSKIGCFGVVGRNLYEPVLEETAVLSAVYISLTFLDRNPIGFPIEKKGLFLPWLQDYEFKSQNPCEFAGLI